jgi:hypothetical protein
MVRKATIVSPNSNLLDLTGFWIVMLNEVKHLGLEQDLCQVVGVRFFAALRMTSIIYSSQNYTYVKVSQVVNLVFPKG